MMLKKDIENREDIYKIVKEFSVKLMNDEVMIHFFKELEDPILLEEHLQVLVDFWDNIIFYSGAYQKNAMKPHIEMQNQKPFQKIHFTHWLSHFNATVDGFFEGQNAHNAKSRALSIATVMEIRIGEFKKN